MNPGTLLAGRYRIVRPIGQGGMGVVYEAEHVALGRRVALKVLFDDDQRAVKRFQQEGRAMAKLSHPHIVSVVDYIAQVGDPPMLVMELLEGEPLAAVLRREGALPMERALRIATQILRGLAAAHDAGIVHRDVKPSNVFLTRDERGDEAVKLLDFGLAKLFDGGAVKTTLGGGVMGTTSYLAPEQIETQKGRKIDGRVDVHAVGIILYEMLVGRRPWRERNPNAIAIEIATEPRPHLREARPDLPEELGDVVDKALAIDRDARHRDAFTMLRALSKVTFAPSPKDTIVDPRAPLAFGGDDPEDVRRTQRMVDAPPRPVATPRGPARAPAPSFVEAPRAPTHARTIVALVIGFVLGALAAAAAFMMSPRLVAPPTVPSAVPVASAEAASPASPATQCLPPLDPPPCASAAPPTSAAPADLESPTSF